MWVIWNKTTFGKNMFALGANEEGQVSGVNVFATTIIVFALAGASMVMLALSSLLESLPILQTLSKL